MPAIPSTQHWLELLNKNFDLKNRSDEVRQQAAIELRNYVTTQVGEMQGEMLKKFMDSLSQFLSTLLASSNVNDKCGALSAIWDLLEVNFPDTATNRISWFYKFLVKPLENTDPAVFTPAAKCFGRLLGSTENAVQTATEFSEREVKKAIEYLADPKERRLAGILICRETAINAPALFYPHLPAFFESFLHALHDPNPATREATAQTLRAALALVKKRENTARTGYLAKAFEGVFQGLSMKDEIAHGSLLGLAEIVVNRSEAVREKYKEVVDMVYKLKDSKDKTVRRAAIQCFPRLAEFAPDNFANNYLQQVFTYLLECTKKDGPERSVAFLAIGEIAKPLENHPHKLAPFMDGVFVNLKNALVVPKSSSKKTVTPFCHETLKCLENLAITFNARLESFMPHDTLPLIFLHSPLTDKLTSCLTTLATRVPQLLPSIQERLLDLLSTVLAKKPFAQTIGNVNSRGSRQQQQQPQPTKKPPGPEQDLNEETIALALTTLGSFDFVVHALSDFVRDYIINYLDDDSALIRREAAITCSKLALRPGEFAAPHTHLFVLVGEIIEKLLIVGIADHDVQIRKVILSSMDKRYDPYLAQAENLRSLFMALNDEVFEIRELAITIIGRLSTVNPAYVMPALRKTLVQLLTDLEFSGDSKNKEESARLISLLILASGKIIKPYVEPILRALLPKLRDPSTKVVSSVLTALGELSAVAGETMLPYMQDLLPLIIDTFQDQASITKREVALRALGQLVKSTGYAIQPFVQYPKLLELLLNALQTETSSSIRREVIKVLGILGAIDPYRYKTQLKTRKQDSEAPDDADMDGLSGNSTSEDFFPTVAINALMKILSDPSLSAHHSKVVESVVYIFKNYGLKCVPYLPYIMPPYLSILRTCEISFKATLFDQLGLLVSIVKQHIREYLSDLFSIIQENWETSLLPTIIFLVEEIAKALGAEFKVHLPTLIPLMLKVLHTMNNSEIVGAVLHAFEVFGRNLDDYLHLVIPTVVKVFSDMDASNDIRIAAIRSIARLSGVLDLSDFVSRISQPLARILDTGVPELRDATLDTLAFLVYHLGANFAVFIPMMNKFLTKAKISGSKYEILVSRLLKNQPLEPEEGEESLLPTIPHSRNDSLHQGKIVDIISTIRPKKLKSNEANLRKAWETGPWTKKEDWADWMRRFSIELIRESSSPALRTTLVLGQAFPPLARELFNASFVSCWIELDSSMQEQLVASLENALSSPHIPLEILQSLLNLAEFMEHDDKPLPIDPKKLGALAEKCHAYAKALHYKEEEFRESVRDPNMIEELISINNNLQQHEAAIGILLYAQEQHNVELKESWYEKLQRWEDALEAYSRKLKEDPNNTAATLGQMRCLHAFGEWEELATISRTAWRSADGGSRKSIAPLAAAAAWNLGHWDVMEEYLSAMNKDSVEANYYRAILDIHRSQYDKAQHFINRARELLDTELSALVAESYSRAYNSVVQAQLLSELEEVIEYKLHEDDLTRQQTIKKTWASRLKGLQRNVEIWQRSLAVHSLVLGPKENVDMLLKFAGMCRKSGRLNLAQKAVSTLMGAPATQFQLQSGSRLGGSKLPIPPKTHPKIIFNYLKNRWAEGGKTEAFQQLKEFIGQWTDDRSFAARCFLKLGEWQVFLQETLDQSLISQTLGAFKSAIEYDPYWYKAWHSWALMNFEVVSHYEKTRAPLDSIACHVVPAIQGFFRSISLGSGQSLQDTLRLLTLWFRYGAQKEVEAALIEGFNTVSIDNWLQVIPQIIARIHSPIVAVRRLIHDLLSNVGKEHPQALVYPLTVACKSQTASRLSANTLLELMRRHSKILVDQAEMVSQELIRVSIIWHEMWHEALEEASRFYFTEHNPEAMLNRLAPLHQMIEKGPETLREISFQHAFGRDLQEALEWCKRYTRTKQPVDLNQAWDIYYHVFRRIAKILLQLKTLELEYISPKLLTAKNLELAVPGTYRAGEPIVKISSFSPTLTVITSKQRPRKLSIMGSDGVEHTFLLKGHEDLRQDERVMQLFGLVNTLLASDRETSKSHLVIQRYAVIPLSPNSGLIGWVPHCDTLHALITNYRTSKSVELKLEHKRLGQMCQCYDALMLIQKVDVFQYAIEGAPGDDLSRVLWLKSRNSEAWLERRTNYTRSLAVMSMVGYILGLGDRHPSNLMLHRYTGKIIHIDFGDCFEVAMTREKFPEKVPFRLTRMLVNAMEVSGIEGNFRFTCENVMRVMREHKESLMAVLEAFVYDPLINWRLLTPQQDVAKKDNKEPDSPSNLEQVEQETPESIDTSRRVVASNKRNESQADDESLQSTEVLNDKAVSVVSRINKKLTGRDFSSDTLDVPAQVRKLIEQATSLENLCQSYLGWCPFW